jgi:hypothetical protein
MVSVEEQAGQSGKARSSLRRRLAECGLAWSIVPATGPSLRATGCTGRPSLDLSSLASGRRRGALGAEGLTVREHAVQNDGELSSQRHFRLAHTRANGKARGPAL